MPASRPTAPARTRRRCAPSRRRCVAVCRAHRCRALLYYRGLVFRKLGKPGFAVSDLTSALWLKNGLSEAERADAIKVRALAYNEAGISDVPPVPQSSVRRGAGAARPEQRRRRRKRRWPAARRAPLQCPGGADPTNVEFGRRRRILLEPVRRRIIERGEAGRGADEHRLDHTGTIAPAGAEPPRSRRPTRRRRSGRRRSLLRSSPRWPPSTSPRARPTMRRPSPAQRRRASTNCRSPPYARARRPRL